MCLNASSATGGHACSGFDVLIAEICIGVKMSNYMNPGYFTLAATDLKL